MVRAVGPVDGPGRAARRRPRRRSGGDETDEERAPRPRAASGAVGDSGSRGGCRSAGAGGLRAGSCRAEVGPTRGATPPGLEVPDDLGRRRRARLRRLRGLDRPGGAPPGARRHVVQRQGRRLGPPSPVVGTGGAPLRTAARLDSAAGRGARSRYEDRVRRPAGRPEGRSHRRGRRAHVDRRRPRHRDHRRCQGDTGGAAPRATTNRPAGGSTRATGRPPTWPRFGRTGSRRTTSSSLSVR